MDIIISQSHSWNLFYFACDQNKIDTLGFYNDYRNGLTISQPWVDCEMTPVSLCSPSGFSMILVQQYCTDFNLMLDLSSGAMITQITLQRTTNIVVGYSDSAWSNEIKNAAGNSAGAWSIITRIDLTQKYPINSSPGLKILRIEFIFNSISIKSSHRCSSNHSGH